MTPLPAEMTPFPAETGRFLEIVCNPGKQEKQKKNHPLKQNEASQ